MRRVRRWSARSGKRPAELCASLTLPDGRAVPVTITDLSHLGCKLTTAEMLPVSEIVELEVPGRELARARVHWSMFGKAGLLFVKESNRADLVSEA